MKKYFLKPGKGNQEATGRGFTLLELLIVIAIMGIMATISYLGVKENLPRWRLNAAARMLRGDLVDARSRAARDMREYRLRIANGTSYVMEIGNVRAGSTAWVAPPPPAPPARDLSTDFPGITIDTGVSTSPIFRPNGILQPGQGNILVRMASNKGEVKTISISMAGRVRIN